MIQFLQRALVLSISIFIFSCSNSSDSSPTAGKGIEPSELSGVPGDCKAFIEALPNDYFHDWVSVPENPFDTSGPQIQVFYYGPKKLNENVVLFYNGGPGSDSHGTHGLFQKSIVKYDLQEKISFIYMDQRGTGCSSGYPSKLTNDDILRSKWYGSTGIVYDSEAVRKKILGEKKWKIFGQSYGAFIVHRYASLFPNSLTAAYAHANTINADPAQRLYNRIFSQYRVLNMFFAIYPEDKDKLIFLKEFLTLDKCFQTKFVGQVCGHEILSSIETLVGFSNRWPMLHKYINSIVTTTNSVQSVDSFQLSNMITEQIDHQAPDDGYATSVIGYFDRNILPTTYGNCNLVYEKLNAEGILESSLLLNECMLTMQSKRSSTRYEKIKTALRGQTDILTLDHFKEGLAQMTPKSFYLYSGEKDPFVPKESFGEELGVVGAFVNYTHFMDTGHEGFHVEKQVWDDLIR